MTDGQIYVLYCIALIAVVSIILISLNRHIKRVEKRKAAEDAERARKLRETPPKEIVQSLSIINNIHGEERSFNSENMFGLGWKILEMDGNVVFQIRQNMNWDGSVWKSMAVLVNHSVISIKFVATSSTKTSL